MEKGTDNKNRTDEKDRNNRNRTEEKTEYR